MIAVFVISLLSFMLPVSESGQYAENAFFWTAPGDTIPQEPDEPEAPEEPADPPDRDGVPADVDREEPMDPEGIPDEADVREDRRERDRHVYYEPVQPLEMEAPGAFVRVSNDSLSRWEMWSDQGEWLSRQHGVISYQLGGLGRNDGFLIRGHESRHQRVYRDGIPLNERVFGSANRKRLSHYSRLATVNEFNAPTYHRTETSTRRYHVSQPLTLINYEQTAYEYRSTEGYLTQNITPSTNISIAYWGKNESEGYRNSTMGGRNAEVILYHFINDSWLVEGGFIYSGLQMGEPHGYDIVDMFTFPFDRFEVFPNETTAESSMRNSLFKATAYRRGDPGEKATSRISLYHDRYRRFHYDSADSSYIRNHTTGLTARHIEHAGPFELQGDVRSEWTVIDRDRFQTMDIDSWIFSEGMVMAGLPLPRQSRLHTWGRAGWRTDGHTDYEIGSQVTIRLSGNLSARASYSRGEHMPQAGHLYWNRDPVRGDEDIGNEVVERAVAGLHQGNGRWDAGVELHASRFERPILVDQDSVFTQAGSYASAGATTWISFNGDRIEFSLSGTYQNYISDDDRLVNQLLDRSGHRIWGRASFYYKNYVLDSASYIKGGFYLQASPNIYRSAQYYPSMDYWDPNSWHPAAEATEAQALPEFARLDLDLTARVRSVIFLFRLENALDNWLLPGYFETAYHPMPSTRFRFGIRWVLRN
ncbi:hypothetical protein [Natronogracilivirga saccharolytica]|uniref:TonB-dependent receptor n=1 Tax=Natronogracilivirga saccharolytica TaxID=2812953 RepID=A0A8J7S6I4_9BACT|nr:hypothetical protein [Natronogracilivirga saccharolytica]MBP3191183.1 hypothetical protein [Natronogracilivirga saccharolytica]